MKSDGFSLDDKRFAISENDIPDIVALFHNLESEKTRKCTEKSFLVPKEEIVSNGYDLSINKYKEGEHIAKEYPEPMEIIADIENLMNDLSTGLAGLKELI